MRRPATATYEELRPPPELTDVVVCGWWSSTAEPHVQPVLPDGCVDVIHRGGAPPVVVGPMTRAEDTPVPAGTSYAALRLRPGAWHALTGVPANALTDASVPLVDVLGRRAGALGADTAPVAVRMRGLVAFARRHAVDAPRPVAEVAGAVRWLDRAPRGRVEQLARELGWSARQLQRRFGRAVGLTPKRYQRIARLQATLAAAHVDSDLDQAVLAAVHGYADQAHLAREVRNLTGRTPTDLLRDPHSALFTDVAAPPG